jgi:hypothetical protein
VPIDEVTRMHADARTVLDVVGTERLPDPLFIESKQEGSSG